MIREQPPDRLVTNQHYDIPPELFQLFLDPTMKYSCGLYLNDDDSLERAQLQKLDFIAQHIGAAAGRRILDVGCGWGSLLFFLAGRYGCETVGLTLSRVQADYLQRKTVELGLESRVRWEIAELVEASFPPSHFDAVTFVGTSVHMPDKGRLLKEASRILRRGGQVYLSETMYRSRALYERQETKDGTAFLSEEVFGWGQVLPLSSFIQCFEDAGFSMRALKDLTADYVRTLEHWKAATLHSRETMEAIQPGSTDFFVRYFDTAHAAFGYMIKQYAIVASKSRGRR